ncbi:hypothetical protein HAALTHF_18280n [Vreelandella aquamarina]|nr:hypothetical protein HAALTHF_18280n [Halomonas axialensis]
MALLFQAVYLTLHEVREEIPNRPLYRLGFLNQEVEMKSLNEALLPVLGLPGLLRGEGRALAQLKAKGYADKYRDRGMPIYLLGVEFSKEQSQVVAFEGGGGAATMGVGDRGSIMFPVTSTSRSQYVGALS